ncbi:ABC transporter substrate-binding protein [Gracilibacillus sp. JCM 18860]|uniref:ABC transporter substrate-binding protein n=1 Tax=Gracilibacillus sp. JCM 18860 TaxID=1306159 RepID=UPI0006D20F52
MLKKWISLMLLTLLFTILVACGQEETQEANSSSGKEEAEDTSQSTEINYLGETYEVPKDPSIVITGSLEAMEDALMLGIEPIGAISVGGEFPELYQEIVGSAESIGEKQQPNLEKILELNPDVILSTTKFPEDVSSKLNEIATVIPVSHLSTDWKDNLLLMGELSGDKEKAEQILADYDEQLEEIQAKASEQLQDKTAVVVRIRSGNIMIYSQNTFFNPSLYEDFGLAVPSVVEAAEAQEAISLEKFSEVNPDYIFVQYAESENADNPEALSDLEVNPIWQSLQAVQNDQVYVNVVDPLAQGGTAWSKIEFLKAFKENVLAE